MLGEEAHIVSEEPNGPRFRPMPKSEVDTYTNLILLCPADHKIVDEQINYYTEQHLLELKRTHEQWVKEKISPATPAIKIRDPEADKPIMLQRIDTGKELMNILAGTLALHQNNPEPRSSEEAGRIGSFFQNTTDSRDVWDDLEPSGHIQAEFWLNEEITQLHKAGFVVYGARRNHIVEGGVKDPKPWPVAYLVIYRSDDEDIKGNPTEKSV
ncbi:hypothetical protein [Dictyobacter formicarum]|uniref:hypothetical protein n=1 Tax=Dictyobacter formicarum TaxID=2778368 RepID=UPI001915577E|nr:hypothetical protein [Dictyobacter formicarum]